MRVQIILDTWSKSQDEIESVLLQKDQSLTSGGIHDIKSGYYYAGKTQVETPIENKALYPPMLEEWEIENDSESLREELFQWRQGKIPNSNHLTWTEEELELKTTENETKMREWKRRLAKKKKTHEYNGICPSFIEETSDYVDSSDSDSNSESDSDSKDESSSDEEEQDEGVKQRS